MKTGPRNDEEPELEFEPPDPDAEPLATRLPLGEMRPINDPDKQRITAKFAASQIGEIDNLKAQGNYRRALQIGTQYWAYHYSPDFEWPLYMFLSEIAAKMALILDPVRDREECAKWKACLNAVLIKLSQQQTDDPSIRYYFIVLYLIRDFFDQSERYLNAIEKPGEVDKKNGWEFAEHEWKMLATRIELAQAPEPAPKSATAEAPGDRKKRQTTNLVTAQLRIRSDHMLELLKNQTLRMRAVTVAEKDRYKQSLTMQDRDSAVRSRLHTPSVQKGLGEAHEMNTQYLKAFKNPAEREVSPLALSTRTSQVRVLIDQGEYFQAIKEGNILIRELSKRGENKLLTQLYGTMGYGLLIFGEMVMTLPQEDHIINKLTQEAQKFKGYHPNRWHMSSRIIDLGINYIRAGLNAAVQTGNVELTRQLRSHLLFAVSLKLHGKQPLPEELGNGKSLSIVQRCINDLDHLPPLERASTTIPRLTQAIYHMRQERIGDFETPLMQGLLEKVRQYAPASVKFLEEEIDSRNIPLDDNLRLTEAAIRTHYKRPGIPNRYYELLEVKRSYVSHFSQSRRRVLTTPYAPR